MAQWWVEVATSGGDSKSWNNKKKNPVRKKWAGFGKRGEKTPFLSFLSWNNDENTEFKRFWASITPASWEWLLLGQKILLYCTTRLNGNKQLETVVVFTFIQSAANRALMASTYMRAQFRTQEPPSCDKWTCLRELWVKKRTHVLLSCDRKWHLSVDFLCPLARRGSTLCYRWLTKAAHFYPVCMIKWLIWTIPVHLFQLSWKLSCDWKQ